MIDCVIYYAHYKSKDNLLTKLKQRNEHLRHLLNELKNKYNGLQHTDKEFKKQLNEANTFPKYNAQVM